MFDCTGLTREHHWVVNAEHLCDEIVSLPRVNTLSRFALP